MRLMMVDDDRIFGDALRRHLTRDGYAVDWFGSGKAMLAAVESNVYDCLLLDLCLPDARGSDLIRQARARVPTLPSIVITARATKAERVDLLDLGADDFIAKPIDLDEVSARIRALTRRCSRPHATAPELRHGPLKLDPARRLATWRGRAVALTNKEYWVLETFLKHKHQILTRAQLEQTLYGWSDQVESNAVEVYIHYLRRKFCQQLLLTVRGVGYQLGTLDDVDLRLGDATGAAAPVGATPT